MTKAGAETINDSKLDRKKPATKKSNPPTSRFRQAMAVTAMRTKLGVKCIIRAINH